MGGGGGGGREGELLSPLLIPPKTVQHCFSPGIFPAISLVLSSLEFQWYRLVCKGLWNNFCLMDLNMKHTLCQACVPSDLVPSYNCTTEATL